MWVGSLSSHFSLAVGRARTGAPIRQVRTKKTLWSWFNTWDVTKYNITTQEIDAVYNDPDVLTLDELPDWRA